MIDDSSPSEHSMVFVVAQVTNAASFVLRHPAAMEHSVEIVNHVTDAVRRQASGAIRIWMVSDYAVFFFARKADHENVSGVVGGLLGRVVTAFARAVESPALDCDCDACASPNDFGLHLTVHTGEALETEVHGAVVLSGVAPILVRRLAEDSTDGPPRLLITDDARPDVLLPDGMELQAAQPIIDDFGPMATWLSHDLVALDHA